MAETPPSSLRRSTRNTRAPGRYRESPEPELPPNPIFALPTIQYNPNLPPAAFPTVPLGVRPKTKLEVEGGKLRDLVASPALVFRDQRVRMMEADEPVQTVLWDDESDYEYGDVEGGDGGSEQMYEGPWEEFLDESGETVGERVFLPVSFSPIPPSLCQQIIY